MSARHFCTGYTNLYCTFRKSYRVTWWTPITAYKLVEYLTNIHLMLFKKNHVATDVHFMVFKHDIFLCLQLICCVFCSNLKNENIRDSVQRGHNNYSCSGPQTFNSGSCRVRFFLLFLFYK